MKYNNSKIIPFSYDNSLIKTIKDENGNIFLVAKDICDVLGYKNVAMTLKKLDDDERGLKNFYTLGGEQSLSVITESGLYSLILRSTKQEAKTFKKWVTSEVLPQIRKSGIYSVENTVNQDALLSNEYMKKIDILMQDMRNQFIILKSDIRDSLDQKQMTIYSIEDTVNNVLKKTKDISEIYKEKINKTLSISENKKILDELNQIKKIVSINIPEIYNKEFDMYIEDIELLEKIVNIITSDNNKTLESNSVKYFYFCESQLNKTINSNQIYSNFSEIISAFFQRELFTKLIVDENELDYVVVTKKSKEILSKIKK